MEFPDIKSSEFSQDPVDQAALVSIRNSWRRHSAGWCDEVKFTILDNLKHVRWSKSNTSQPSNHKIWKSRGWNFGTWVLMVGIYNGREKLGKMQNQLGCLYPGLDFSSMQGPPPASHSSEPASQSYQVTPKKRSSTSDSEPPEQASSPMPKRGKPDHGDRAPSSFSYITGAEDDASQILNHHTSTQARGETALAQLLRPFSSPASHDPQEFDGTADRNAYAREQPFMTHAPSIGSKERSQYTGRPERHTSANHQTTHTETHPRSAHSQPSCVRPVPKAGTANYPDYLPSSQPQANHPSRADAHADLPSSLTPDDPMHQLSTGQPSAAFNSAEQTHTSTRTHVETSALTRIRSTFFDKLRTMEQKHSDEIRALKYDQATKLQQFQNDHTIKLQQLQNTTDDDRANAAKSTQRSLDALEARLAALEDKLQYGA